MHLISFRNLTATSWAFTPMLVKLDDVKNQRKQKTVPRIACYFFRVVGDSRIKLAQSNKFDFKRFRFDQRKNNWRCAQQEVRKNAIIFANA